MTTTDRSNKLNLPEKLKPQEYEVRWQKAWEEKGLFSPDMKSAKKPFYNLMMFPYPSAEGLHVGNMYAFTGVDVFGRFKRMQGFDVFEPIGLDGFGIHSENYALKVNRHPKEQAKISEANFYRQMRAIGNSFDWKRTVETYDPDYYRWTQWLFVQMFKQGLAYRAYAFVNWCPSCKTVLADEQVIDEKCERCGTEVIKKELEQWFFRITAYAEKLLQNTYKPSFKWTEKVKVGQRNWIGKKTGINIKYPISNSNNQIEVFTTRPDTNFGATFIVISPEHSLTLEITTKEHKEDVSKYIEASKKISKEDRIAAGRKKTGVFTGSYAINNLSGKKMPVWVSDFVLTDVGTGVVVGVPGHDKRDFEFAQEKDLPIKRVVVASDGDRSEITQIDQVQEDEGIMVNSDFLDGLDIHAATVRIMDYLEEKGWGNRVTSYHIRDWLISRQRYWGAPIPMIYCEKCAKEGKSYFDTEESKKVHSSKFIVSSQMPGWFPVPEEQLPVELPDVENWRPTGTGRGPLAGVPEFYKTICPHCGGQAVLETDVCDTFLDSSWYFLRYPSVNKGERGKGEEESNSRLEIPWDREITRKWFPVSSYIGGAEHTVLHLLYARFVWMALKDQGYISLQNETESEDYNPDEPFQRFFAHGLIIKDGVKMSKSKGNVVIPDEYIKLYGADTLRTYLMFLGPFDGGGDFRDTGIAGMYKWLSRVWRLSLETANSKIQNKPLNYSDKPKMLHVTIKGVTEDLEHLRFNTAIAKLMQFTNWWMEHPDGVDVAAVVDFLKLLAPFAPFMTEELYQKGKALEGKGKVEKDSFESIHLQSWPEHDPGQVQLDQLTVVIQVNGKMRDSIVMTVQNANTQVEVEQKAKQSARVSQWLSAKQIKKVIFVPGKIINFVV